MLTLRRLSAGYHGGLVLHGVDLEVLAGTVHALVGRNGAGKSTLVHAACGLLRPYSGRVFVAGREVTGRPAHRVARAGVGLVPQGRRVFPSLTVAEHLTLAAATRRAARPPAQPPVPRPARPSDLAGARPERAAAGTAQGTARPQTVAAGVESTVGPGAGAGWTVPRVLAAMPRLAERLRHRGDQLSGGEQQMLAIGRALLTQPRALLLDEPCEGLAGDLATRVGEMVAGLARTGIAVLLVEQQLDRALAVADQISVLDYGRLVYTGPADGARADPAPLKALLSIARDGSPGPSSGHVSPLPQRR